MRLLEPTTDISIPHLKLYIYT